jgi:hypothetical protein
MNDEKLKNLDSYISSINKNSKEYLDIRTSSGGVLLCSVPGELTKTIVLMMNSYYEDKIKKLQKEFNEL